MGFLPVDDQLEIISKGTEEVIPLQDLRHKLESSIKNNKPLVVKLGCDPSRPDLHIGHSVVLQKLRDFQDLGHQAILVIGDFTAMIGDPSERNKTRPQLTLEEAKANAESYIEQSKVILDVKTLKVLFNSTWLNKMNFSDVINMSSKYTVARMIERDDFTKRFESEIPISMHEFLYPLAQAMDSVEIKSDVELGGTDQKFNLLVGRDLQREYDQEPQSIITLPLLEGTDGIEKMSKSYDNYIALDDSAQDMYGKLMSINDSMITKYYKLAVFAEKEKVLSIEEQLKDSSINPRDIKRDLAKDLVERYYDKETALEAEQAFDQIFVKKSIPDDMPIFQVKIDSNILDILLSEKLIASKAEGKRLIGQNAIKIDGEVCSDIGYVVSKGCGELIVKIGKRRFLKISG
ncbi:tyrosine--tRNA ligase [Candidatus Marinimicrobia bacterium]|jgi:tyrosyl-tRNA synthetase|uniref:tyrosine--tRNA ligase n=1 Tax=uncultured Dokdonia sp. TaxID=575653 RepID=UPI0003A5C800|nr:tyrosine--tRNA ligase [uncultured Dokdonia sp.]MDA9841622.1 tyrosine--tRNA ligase [Candidatus Neomarinimicrobiota bacterium]MDC1146131.1 tyrosine--tRNA ligase [Candidatus Neomarinimicrobiota bacterium]MDC3287473.1 tyrosine--tRNA ligase [Candidatus Neomarinimicrobiota bacterium]|tara:strand:- start:9616 stop:10827 length:1212 start_codon:yes stop_codon:yes gene_type:complete